MDDPSPLFLYFTYRRFDRKLELFDRFIFTIQGIAVLWCQHYTLAVTKLEYNTYLLLREGDLTQNEAIEVILDAKFNQK